MEKLSAAVLNAKYGNIIMPNAVVNVPWGWHNIVSCMLGKLEALPTDIRAFLIVQGIAINRDGLLTVSVGAMMDFMPEGGWAEVEAIIDDATKAAAWTCVRDKREGWLVSPPKGRRRPLCPACQQEAGMKAERANA